MTALAFALLFAADFNGSWLIRGDNAPSIRAWNLEVYPTGSYFVTAYGGDRNKITDLKIDGDTITWTIDRKRPAGVDKLVYKARMVDGKLQGTFQINDREPLKWIGWRAPIIKDTDDGSWKEAAPVVLFDGKTLSGWRNTDGWEIVDGVLRNKPPTKDILSERNFWNFRLVMEYKLSERSNSGLGLRGRYELQLIDDYGKPKNYKGHGAVYSRLEPLVNASKPAGEWQTIDVRLVGREVTVKLNGQTLHNRAVIEGLTAMASNPDEDQPGPIQLQGDHTLLEVKRLVVYPLEKK